MKERPILFSTEMVQAIIEGRKTQTRRILKPQLPFYKFDFGGDNEAGYSALTPKGYVEFRGYEITESGERKYSPFYIKPKYGEKDDILWVRETWATGKHGINGTEYLYKADNHDNVQRWKSSIHMPKEACRIRLKIKSIRIERLLDISGQDAIAEGIEGGYTDDGYEYTDYNGEGSFSSPISSYISLWDKINGIGSHKQNPWVWVIEFERIT